VQELDSASQGLKMEQARHIHLDLQTGKVRMQVGTACDFLSVRTTRMHGSIIMARAEALQPQTKQLHVPLGQWHTISIGVPAPGCRPPVKAYTDLRANLGGLVLNMTAGLDPAFASMSQAIKRAIPPSEITGRADIALPDSSVTPLAWWDRMRYQWRGRLKASLNDATVVVAPVHNTQLAPNSQRLVLFFKSLEVASDPDAQLTLSAVTACGHFLVPHYEMRSRPDAQLLRVPFFSLSNLSVNAALFLDLPNGRRAGSHHVFPTIAVGQRLLQDGMQGPVNLPALLSTQAVSIQVVANIRNIALPGHVRPWTLAFCEIELCFLR
jgi:hypothetical protein